MFMRNPIVNGFSSLCSLFLLQQSTIKRLFNLFLFMQTPFSPSPPWKHLAALNHNLLDRFHARASRHRNPTYSQRQVSQGSRWCKENEQTVYHLLFRCPKWARNREKFLTSLRKKGILIERLDINQSINMLSGTLPVRPQSDKV